ncbi:MAG TPA: TFIIB-type zinc ribbon-containing protein [Rariglobus sp.]
MHDQSQCDGCGVTQFADDPATGDVVCTACGLVAPGDHVYVDTQASPKGSDDAGSTSSSTDDDNDSDDGSAFWHASHRTGKRRKRTRRHHPYATFIRADSLLAVAAHAVAVEYDVDPIMLVIEATRAGIPADARGSVNAALCQAIARLRGGDGGDGGKDECADLPHAGIVAAAPPPPTQQ